MVKIVFSLILSLFVFAYVNAQGNKGKIALEIIDVR
jgi:hypothetical protein